MQPSDKKIGIVIMAAGGSRRMGRPKQLLAFEGISLIQKVIDTSISTQLAPIVLVLGAFEKEIKAALDQHVITIIENPHWESGMAGSLVIGLETILQIDPAIDGVIFMVCDQPFVTKEVIDALINVQAATGFDAAACTYKGKMGTPALLLSTYFTALLQLKGDTGARKILQENSEKVALVNFDAGIFDIDTPEDFQLLSKNTTNMK